MKLLVPALISCLLVSCQKPEDPAAAQPAAPLDLNAEAPDEPATEPEPEPQPEPTPEPEVELEPEATPEPEPATEQDPDPADPTNPSSYVGMTIEAASERATTAGIPNRVTQIDGESQPATLDYLPERLNFAIEKGIVVSVSKG
jgi:hypothetical protein